MGCGGSPHQSGLAVCRQLAGGGVNTQALRPLVGLAVGFLLCLAAPLGAAQDPCAALPTSGRRVVNRPCNPQQDCIDGIPGSVRGPSRDAAVTTCRRLPTSSTCPRTEDTNPRQDCMNTLAKVQDLINTRTSCQNSANLLGDITAILFEFQKLAGKEAREDRAIAAEVGQSALARKADKVRDAGKSIERRMEEASERAKHAIDAATAELEMGIVSGMAQVAAGAWASTENNLREIKSLVLELRRKTTPGALVYNLQRALDQFVLQRARATSAAKRADDEIKKKMPQ